MRRRFLREEILRRLQKTISERRPIIGAGASAGIIAKCAEIGGADLIIVYSTGKSRLMGLPTSRLGNANTVTLGMCEEILNVVKDTPVVGGIEAGDPNCDHRQPTASGVVRVGVEVHRRAAAAGRRLRLPSESSGPSAGSGQRPARQEAPGRNRGRPERAVCRTGLQDRGREAAG